MNDIEYMLKRDQREKKSQGRGIYAKKGGSRSKACRLPSDNLTKKELLKMNGEVVSYNLKGKMEWKQVLKMPKDLAKEYLMFLKYECKGRNIDIADFLGVDMKALSHFIAYNFPEMSNGRGGGGARSQSPEWIAFLKSLEAPDETAVVCVEEPIVEEPVIEEPVKAEKPSLKLSATDGVLHFIGDPYMAFAKTVKVLDDGKAYDITIMYKEVNYAD